jgi:hypothetical protein
MKVYHPGYLRKLDRETVFFLCTLAVQIPNLESTCTNLSPPAIVTEKGD